MRILEVTCWLPEGGLGGGAAVVCRDNTLALQRLGAEVRIFAGSYAGDRPRLVIWNDDTGEMPVTRLSLEPEDRLTPFRRKHNPDAAAAFGRHLEKQRPDLVHFHALQGLGFDCLTQAARRGIPTAVTLHDHWWVSPLRFLTNLRTGHLAWSARTMEVLRVRFRRRPVSSIAPLLQRLDIGDGANFPEQRTGSTTVQLREAWQTITSLRRTLGHADLLVAPSQFILDVHRACGLSRFTLNRNAAPVEAASVTRRDPVSGPLRFGFMGGTNVWKGVRLALEAMQLFEPREAELHIWGAENAPTEPSALGPNIHWRGRLPAERRLEAYAEMDVLMALSLHHENSPMNVIEAQATRAPVIATRVGGHMELIREGEDGFLVTRDDFKALVAAMRRLVEDRALARSMSERAPQRPLGNEMAQRLLDEFKRLAKSGVT